MLEKTVIRCLFYASKRACGIGAPKLYERYLTAQMSWLRKCSLWNSSDLKLTPDWVLPLFELLVRYKLPPVDIILGMGICIIDIVAKLCELEGLEFFSELFLLLLAHRKKYMRKLSSYCNNNDNGGWLKLAGSLSWVGATKLSWRGVKDRPNWKDRPPDLLGSKYLINLVRGKLHVVGNIGANLDLSFNHDCFELIDDFDDSLFRQVRTQVKDALRLLKKRASCIRGVAALLTQ